MTDWLAPALAFALLHSIWQCAVLAGAAWFSLRALSRASAALRHLIAMAFLVAMVLAPAAGIVIFLNADTAMPAGELSELVKAWVGPLAAPILVVAWAAGAGFMFARYVTGFRVISAMHRRASTGLTPAWTARFERIREKIGATASVAVRVSNEVITPCVTHILRPVIWLPASLMMRLHPDQLEALLAHELAHIARKDWLWSGLQNVIEALLFYHPAVWWLGRRIRAEREHACDDIAVAACGDAVALAEALADLEIAKREHRVLLAANGGALLQRIGRLLAPAPARSWRGPPAFLGAVIMVAALCVAQADAGGGRPHDLHVEASTSGALGPGDFREITAHEEGRVRFYRISVGEDGNVTEIYRENGRDRPIDATVRAWLAGLSLA